MDYFEARVEDFFRQKNWRMTSAVRNIAHLLQETSMPLSVQQIQSLLLSKEHSVDPSTIYRILERFEEGHLIHNLQGQVFPCSNPKESSRQHHFLLCEKCGHAEEIFLDYQNSISRQLAQEKNFLLKKVEMYFWGICSRCFRPK
ncbi:transcriptional repressor [Candidatus Gracilibacteria bacterium]|nr:transcriptional repressor [Candidatus Gracilibacteria bacterium]MCF7819190.1 transcriptional repressor [Candidatus Gracilibacteria bacterium]